MTLDDIKAPTTAQLIRDTLFLMDIHQKTEQAGKCLEWTGALDGYGVPICRLPGDRRLRSLRRVILEMNGRNLDGLLAIMACTNPLCLCHLKAVTRQALQVRSAKTTNWAKSPARCAAIAQRRRATATLDIEKVRDMRERQLTSREAAKEFGVAQSTAANALAYRTWRDYSNPFAGLMA